jgi:L-histidine Nalpha-methyltransferase
MVMQIEQHEGGEQRTAFASLTPLLDEFRSFLRGDSRGDFMSYIYGNGDAWRDVVAADLNYDFPRAESSVLISNSAKLSGMLPSGTVLIEIGPGESEAVKGKTLKIIKSIDPTAYYPIDLQNDFLTAAEETVRKKFPSLPILPLTMDFFKAPKKLELGPDVSTTLFIGGGTLAQLSLKDPPFGSITLSAALRNFHQMVPSDEAYMLMTLDTTNKPAKAVNKYMGEHVHHFLEGFIDLLHADGAALGLSKDRIHHRSRWNREYSRVEHNLEVLPESISLANLAKMQPWLAGPINWLARRIEQPIAISIGDETYQLRAGDIIHLADSHKWNADLVEGIAKENGWAPHGRLTGKNGIMVAVLKKTPLPATPSLSRRYSAIPSPS